MRRGSVLLLLACLSLIAPAGAAAHARSATVALAPDPRCGRGRSSPRGLAALTAVTIRLGRSVAIPLGSAAGAAAVSALAAFSVADAPNGRVAWTQLGLGLFLAVAMFFVLARSRGARRTTVAGLLGAVAAAVSLGSLHVFRHGVVVSALPATASRLLVEIALVAGASAALVSLRTEVRR